MPEGISAYLQTKTPLYFPEHFTLNEFAILLFSLICTLVFRYAKQIIQSSIANNGLKPLGRRQIENLWNQTLTDREKFVLIGICYNKLNYFQDESDLIVNKIATDKLLNYKLIKPTRYVLGSFFTPDTVKFFIHEMVEKDPELIKLLSNAY